MEKILEYNLNIGIDEKFSVMPVLHDYKVDEIKIESGRLVLISNDVANHYHDWPSLAGFKAKGVRVEYINDDYDTDMLIRVLFNGKRKSNKYYTFCEEFLDTVKEYDRLEIIYPSVSFREVFLTLWGTKGKKSCDILMKIACDKVRYIFNN